MSDLISRARRAVSTGSPESPRSDGYSDDFLPEKKAGNGDDYEDDFEDPHDHKAPPRSPKPRPSLSSVLSGRSEEDKPEPILTSSSAFQRSTAEPQNPTHSFSRSWAYGNQFSPTFNDGPVEDKEVHTFGANTVKIRRSNKGKALTGQPTTPGVRGSLHSSPRASDPAHSLAKLSSLSKTAELLKKRAGFSGRKPSAKVDERVASLAQPVFRNAGPGRKVFAKEEDAKECKFKPKISKASLRFIQQAKGSTNVDDFISRMQSSEKVRRATIEKAKKEAEKEADKMSKRTTLVWDQVAKDFEERLRVQEEKKKQKIEKLKQESMPTFKPAKKRVVVAVDDEGNEIGDVWRAGGGSARLKVKTVGAASKPSWGAVKDDFLSRLDQDTQRWKEKRSQTGEVLDENHTFKPQVLSQKSKALQRNSSGSFLERMEQDLAMRAEKKQQFEETLSEKPSSRRSRPSLRSSEPEYSDDDSY